MPDLDKPTIVAAIYEGVLTIKAEDTSSDIAAIFVNGEEFQNPENGVLAVKLQQFDANMEFFTVQARDEAGNASDVYKLKNPYYAYQVDENGDQIPVPVLPTDVQPSSVNEARGTVTEYANDLGEEGIIPAKEFYTITVDTGKTFYLIIDHTKEENNVYFLTEVSENDLLNVTGTNYQTLEQNTAVVESYIPGLEAMSAEEIAAMYGIGDEGSQNNDANVKAAEKEGKVSTGTVQVNSNSGKAVLGGLQISSQAVTYIAMGIIAVLIILIYYFTKIRSKKKRRKPVEPEETIEDFSEDKENDDDFFK